MDDVKYPDVEVELIGQNGNALNIMSFVMSALRRNGVSREEIAEYQDAAMSGDYNNVLTVTQSWVTVI